MSSAALAFLVLTVGELPKAEAVKIEEVVRVPSYCEGIVFDHAGNGYISHGKFVTKIAPDGKKSQWLDSGGAPHGAQNPPPPHPPGLPRPPPRPSPHP